MLFSDPDNDLQLGRIINNLSDLPKLILIMAFLQTSFHLFTAPALHYL